MANKNNDPSWLEKLSSTDGFWHGLIQQLRLVWRLLRDRRVPIWVKAVPFLSTAYLFIPADIIPDVFVGLGQLDDLAIIALGLKLFLELAPPDILNEHMNALLSAQHEWTVIDGEAELVDDSDSS
ncbi:MAG: DUF1232 domain-containing protein [Anaerolineales bacterium]|nr:DUF1232 domain-containing protein [Anaerolineales bacterium]